MAHKIVAKQNVNKICGMESMYQVPTDAKLAKACIEQLKEMCESVIKSGDNSQNEAITAYVAVLDSLSERLKEEKDLTIEDRNWISEKMISVAQMIDDKDSQHKAWLNNLFAYAGGGMLLIVMGFAGILLDGKLLPMKK